MKEPENSIPTNQVMREQEAAVYLRVSISNLRRRRYQGTGPTYLQIGRGIRYRRSDLDAYLEACAVASTLGHHHGGEVRCA